MPMIPKPMTDINSESAYEKLKFIPEHYNEIMAAYTDIMEHLRLPVMTDTGGGGSGEECLHEVVEVTNPCPAYVQFNLNIGIPLTGIHFVYKNNYGDYNVQEIYYYNTNGVSSGLKDILNYLSLRALSYYGSLHVAPILPAPSNTDLVYAAMLVDKTTGEPVEDVNIHTDIDGISGSETTYTDLTNVYDVKLVLADPSNYSTVPTILGDLLEKIVELRSNVDINAHKAKLPTPEELLRILQVSCNNSSSTGRITAKIDIALLTPEERARVRSNLHMNTSNSIPGDSEYMYAINLFCHPNTLNGYHRVLFNCMGGYSKGFIGFNAEGSYGLIDNGCGDSSSVTYRLMTLNLTPVVYSGSYEYFILPESYGSYGSHIEDSGVTVTPHTFKLIQSKEGIDRRL